MYMHYAESQRWKVELVECEEIGIGGMKNVTFMIDGKGAYSKMKYESGMRKISVSMSCVHLVTVDSVSIPRTLLYD